MSSNSNEYRGWKLYFPTKGKLKTYQFQFIALFVLIEVNLSVDFECESSLHKKIQIFKNHITNFPNSYNLNQIKRQLWFPVIYQFVISDPEIQSKWPSLEQDVIENPKDMINCLGLAMHQCVLSIPDWRLVDSQSSQQCSITASSSSLIKYSPYIKCIVARLSGFGLVFNLRSLKVGNFGRLISVHGTIIRVNHSKIICNWLAFQCSSCSAERTIKQLEGLMTQPKSCNSIGCRARGNFKAMLKSPSTRSEAFQIVRLQESMHGAQFVDSGRVPRTMEIELSQDLVDLLNPGDDVTVTGILNIRSSSTEQNKFHRKTLQPSMYKMYMEGLSVSSNKNLQSSRKNELTQKDHNLLTMIKSEPSPIRLLVQSLCPSIYGHEMVKAGMILGLIGGAAPPGNDNEPSVNGFCHHRMEAHVLVVGDPGVGKSKMLQACSNVSPRGIFVGGNSSSNAGLTATVRHEKGTSGSLEAGALVLADQGACCIDEFDKMPANHHSLLEVMESQTVSVAKAGVLCTLPARTCVLAAANPANGHYNKAKTVSENLKMKSALLSRFDLIFILLDRPDPQLDILLTAHIQTLSKTNTKTNSTWFASSFKSTLKSHEQIILEPLRDRLKLRPNEKIDALPHVLIQKYIGYARKNFHPTISTEAKDAIKSFYLQLRQVNFGVDSIPVTTRQLEALVRLAQARARIDLAKEATLSHAQDVIEISKYSMADVFSTNIGTLSLTRNINGSGMSQTSQIKKFLKILQAKTVTLQKTVFLMDELKEFANICRFAGNFNQMIDSLNVQGILLKKGVKLYKFISDN